MIRKTCTLIIAMSLLITGCIGQRWIDVKLENSEREKIGFLDVTSDKRVIYTVEDKSYESKKDQKNLLDFMIISKFSYKNKNYYKGIKKGKVGIVNSDLKEILAFNYEDIEKINDKYVIGKQEENLYLIDMEKYEMKGPYSNIAKIGKNIIQVSEGSNTKIINDKGEELKNIKAENIFFVRDDKIVTRNGEKFGLYDIEEEKYISINNEEVYFSQNNILTKKSGVYYLNNEKVNLERVYPSINDVVLYDYKNGFKLLNLRDLKHSEEIYQEIEYRFDNYIIVGKDSKYGVINKYNYKNPEYQFDYIMRVGANSFQGGTDERGLFALIVEGIKVTDEKYENFIEVSHNYYLGLINNNYHLLDKKGKLVLETNKRDLIFYNEKCLVLKEKDKEKIFLLGSDIDD